MEVFSINSLLGMSEITSIIIGYYSKVYNKAYIVV